MLAIIKVGFVITKGGFSYTLIAVELNHEADCPKSVFIRSPAASSVS